MISCEIEVDGKTNFICANFHTSSSYCNDKVACKKNDRNNQRNLYNSILGINSNIIIASVNEMERERGGEKEKKKEREREIEREREREREGERE